MATANKNVNERPKLAASYDQAVDVLYVVLGSPKELEGDGLPGGIELDYAFDGSPCGVTVMGFRRNGWNEKRNELLKVISRHLGIGTATVGVTIEHALRAR